MYGIQSAYCYGTLAQDANLNPEQLFMGYQDSAYMYMTPWVYGKYPGERSSYWLTGGDCGFKFSHRRRSWDTVILLPHSSINAPITDATRIPCGSNIRIYLRSLFFDNPTGRTYIMVSMECVSDPSKSRMSFVPLDDGWVWLHGNVAAARVISFAQTPEGPNGGFHLKGKWTGCMAWDTHGYNADWTAWNPVFETYPVVKTGPCRKMPVVTTNPVNGKNVEEVSIDARP